MLHVVDRASHRGEELASPNLGEARAFLLALDPNAAGFTFATFDDVVLVNGKKRGRRSLTHNCLHGLLDELAPRLAELNAQGAGIFVMVNAGDGMGRSDKHITCVRAVWQDDDQRWQGRYPLPPSIEVQTSSERYQRYWLVDGLENKAHAKVMDRLTVSYGHDKGAKGLSRVLRLPGFCHRKGLPFPVRLNSCSENRYSHTDILKAFPPVEQTNTTAPPLSQFADAEFEQVRDALRFIPADDRDVWLEIGMSIKAHFGDAGRPLWDEWAAQSNKFDRRDQDKIWRSFKREGITISTLFHKAKEHDWRPNSENTRHGHTLKTLKRTFEGFESSSRGTIFEKSSPANWDDEDWPDPEPLPSDLPPVNAFDWDLLPSKLKRWGQDISELIQCPPDFVGVTIMVALATVVGRKVGIRPQEYTHWTVIANLWAMLIGRPGIMKSPAMEAALWPLKWLMMAAVKDFEKKKRDYDIKKIEADLKAEAAKKAARAAFRDNLNADVSHLLVQEEIEEPELRRYVANDTTLAALVEIHRHNQNGILEYRDEIISLLKLMDRDDHAEDRAFRLTGWNGDSPYTADRIGRGLNLHIPGVCLSELGSTQPGRISTYLRHAVKGGVGDDGLMQRFGLITWPDANGAWKDIDRVPDTEGRQEALALFQWLDKASSADLGAHRPQDQNGDPLGVPYLRFDKAGLGIFQEWRRELETRLRSEELHPALESHFAKYRKLVPALALLCHLGDRKTGAVSDIAVSRATSWAEYLESHANRAYASVTMVKVTTAKAILKRIRSGDLTSPFKARDIYHKGWSRLGDKNDVTEALELLVDFNWLAAVDVRTGGRPTTEYHVNPKGRPS